MGRRRHEIYKVLLKIENRIVGNKRNEIPSFKRLAVPIIIHKTYATKNRISANRRFCCTCFQMRPVNTILNCDHRLSLGGAFGYRKSEELFFCQALSANPKLTLDPLSFFVPCFKSRTVGVVHQAPAHKKSFLHLSVFPPLFPSGDKRFAGRWPGTSFSGFHLSVFVPVFVHGVVGTENGPSGV